MSKKNKPISAEEFTRLANNFYNQANVVADISRIGLDSHLFNYVANGIQNPPPKSKVAFCWTCLNPPYWEFAQNMVNGARRFLLPGHEVDFFLWSDIPKDSAGKEQVIANFKQADPNYNAEEALKSLTDLSEFIHKNMTVFSTEAQPWPIPTLMRYHLFLQQEEILKDYDYIFYCDVDMQFVNVVGDEILGKGLTVAPHPGYYIRKELYPPYEPNEKSHAYIKRPGFLANDGGKPRFMPFYAAGGFQGGQAERFIKAMKVMRGLIDKDSLKNYVPIWNDETVWNKYLFDVLKKQELHECVFLTPSYIYPDSLIKEYYEPKVWGQAFMPRLVTLTKSFTVSKEGGNAVQEMIKK